jgi:photosystem II stability/assembly factor-like uncharacterized protein
MSIKQFLFFLVTASFLHSCAEKNPAEIAGPSLIPAEWMYQQRAYPHNEINHASVKRAYKDYQKKKESSASKQLNTWELEGPTNISGRITDIVRHPSDPNTFYIGSAVGGVFKTTDNANSWTPITEDIPTLSVGSLGLSKSDPETIYLGTGEANGSVNSGAFFGSGIYKSTDGGNNWEQKGLENSNQIGRLVVDEENPDLVYAAVTGVQYGYNDERGLYKTVDGGDSWEQILFVNDSVGCIDVVVSPFDKNIIYAAMWERTRRPWIRDYAGPASGVYRSQDGGESWTHLEGSQYGLPVSDDDRGRTGLAISKTTPGVVYAVFTDNPITNRFHGVYKTSDGGENWINIDGDINQGTFSSFGWYFAQLRVDPEDDDIIYVLGQRSYRTTNGGTSWEQISTTHVDAHAMAFFDGNSKDVLLGDDSGIHSSENLDPFFTEFSNLPITQFYEIEVDFLNPEKLLGGTQDNNTLMNRDGAIDNYESIFGGDGFHVKVDPTDSDIVYAESQFGNLGVSFDGGESFQFGLNGIEQSERTNWNTPVFLSPLDPSFVFYGAERLYRSIQAQEWEAISPDLTDGLHSSGSASWGTLTAIGLSAQNLDVIYVGTDDANVWTTRDGGENWQKIDADLPERYVNHITVNPDNDLEAVVCFSGYRYLDYQAHVLRTQDGGVTWEDISGDLPEVPANDFVYDPDMDNRYYLATDLGVWYSDNLGENWEIMDDGIPLTIASDLVFHGPTRTLYAGTFGRSMYSVELQLDPSSTSNLSEHIDVNIFPNPTERLLTVDISNNEIEVHYLTVIDYTGKNVLQKNIEKNTDQVQLEVGDLTTGNYMLVLRDKAGKIIGVEKFVKN